MGNSAVTFLLIQECLGTRKKIIFLPDLTVGLLASSSAHLFFFPCSCPPAAYLEDQIPPKNMFFTLVVLHKDYIGSLQYSFKDLILMRRSLSGNRECELLRWQGGT